MATTGRLIVVLRGELGEQLRYAGERFAKAQLVATANPYNTRAQRDLEIARKSWERVDSAQQALGRLNLGDIEDNELEIN